MKINKIRVPMNIYIGMQIKIIVLLAMILRKNKEEAGMRYAQGNASRLFSKIFEPIEGS